MPFSQLLACLPREGLPGLILSRERRLQTIPLPVAAAALGEVSGRPADSLAPFDLLFGPLGTSCLHLGKFLAEFNLL